MKKPSYCENSRVDSGGLGAGAGSSLTAFLGSGLITTLLAFCKNKNMQLIQLEDL